MAANAAEEEGDTNAGEGAPVIAGGAVRLGPKIGSGSFGDVYIGTNMRTGREVAVKLELLGSPRPCLAREARVYLALAGARRVPRVHWAGHAGDYRVLVVDLLGPSLGDLLEFCGGKFGLKTVLALADQMIACVEEIHARGFVHRDIKPDNLCVGLGSRASTLHVIDFGLAEPYVDPASGRHAPCGSDGGLAGTLRYASVGAHLGRRQSRRDDLEALGYVMLYLLRGRLPWQGVQAADQRERQDRIGEVKVACSPQELCEGLPGEFETYLCYCRGLAFDEEPDYARLRGLFRGLSAREGFRDDCVFDWTVFGARVLPEGDCPGARTQREMVGAPENVSTASRLPRLAWDGSQTPKAHEAGQKLCP